MRKNNKGFTLIELLAVIVILGLLMAIAIPSVTKYITESRKKTLISSIDSYVTAVTTAVNDNEFGALSNGDILYYIPVSNDEASSCISLEKGGTDPFGNWKEAYVAVNYDADNYSYNYYFTFYDDAGYGMELTKIENISASSNQITNPSPVDASNITTQISNSAVHTVVLTKSIQGSCFIPGAAKVLSGDGTNISDVIAIGGEQFYVLESDDTTITLLSKYNINPDLNNPVQNKSADRVTFSSKNYWHGTTIKPEYGTSYPAFVYDSNSNLYQYVEAYEQYLKILANSVEATLISHEQMKLLGCDGTVSYSCSTARYEWAKASNGQYWTGSAFSSNGLWAIYGNNYLYSNAHTSGIRPVITINKNEIEK